jgi:hypothetical protein
MRQLRRRAQLYFNCPEKKEDHIERMLRRVEYKDIAFIMEIGTGYGPARLKVKFGMGWMGKGAEIHAVNNLRGEPKGIRVSITISESTRVYYCHIENQKDKKDKIYLDIPNGINYRFIHPDLRHMAKRREEAEEMDEICREINEISNEVLD